VLHRPVKSDLRDAGTLEQDADIIMFCYRPVYYNTFEDEFKNEKLYPGNSIDNLFELSIGKQRDGALVAINYHVDLARHQFFLWDKYHREF